ncbi:hypothetical protein GGR58DRAFT_524755 [Xylaria digitata]|nr:hypothetical protein GGR58DRAFT_524755 [Xylaria digitata]
MGVQPSKSAHPEPVLGIPCPNPPENVTSGPPAQTDSVWHYRSSSPVTAGSFTRPRSVPTPISLTSTSPTSSTFGVNGFNDGKSPETAITLDSSDDDDLFTLLRKNRRVPGEGQKVIHLDARRSIDNELWAHLNARRSSPQKYGQPASQLSGRNHSHPTTNEKHRVGARKTEPQIRSLGIVKKSKHTLPHSARNRSLSSKNVGIRSCVNGEDHISNIYKADSQTESLHPTTNSRIVPPQVALGQLLPSPNQPVPPKADNRGHQTTGSNVVNRSGLTPSQDAHFLPIRSKSESISSRAHQSGKDAMVRSEDNKEHRINTQKQPKKSRTAKKSKLTPFRRANRSIQVHLDTVLESDKLEEYQHDKYVLSRVDAGTIIDDTRPRLISEPRAHAPHQDKACVPSGDRNPKWLPRQPITPNDSLIDGSLNEIDRPSSPPTPSEEPEIAPIEQLESRKRPPEFVVPEFKWGYNIKVVDSVDIILDEKDKEDKAMTIETFADREKANKYLEKWTSPEANGGIEAIARRTTTLEGRERLLKVDIEKSDGQHYLMWVERGIVTLGELKKSKSKQVQWQPNKRPKFFHYIVTCDLITYEINRVTRCEEHDDDLVSLAEQDGGLGSLGQEITLSIEKLSPMTFTYREHANKHAGDLFLERTKVDKQFANRSDAFWWEYNVVPLHKAAVASACKPNGLYEVAMDVCDMSSRLSWNQILVNVHEVDDVTGPVNF